MFLLATFLSEFTKQNFFFILRKNLPRPMSRVHEYIHIVPSFLWSADYSYAPMSVYLSPNIHILL